jgi:tetratricopeptide (TPR) repeat protein
MMRRTDVYRAVLLVSIGLLVLTACAGTPPAPLDAGKTALTSGDVSKAIENLEKAVADKPGSAEAHLALGQAYLRNQRKDDAQKQFEAAFTLDAAAALPVAAQSAEEPFLAGNAHAGLGQLEEAKAAYEDALKLDPKKAAAYTNLGVVYYQQGKLDEAVTQMKKALEIEPQDAETLYMLGAAYVQQNNIPEAEQAFQHALTAKPDLGQAYIGLGNVYLMTKQYDQAVTALQKATELQPNLAEGWLALGQAYAAKSNAPEAAAALDKCLQLSQAGTGLHDKCQTVRQQVGAP